MYVKHFTTSVALHLYSNLVLVHDMTKDMSAENTSKLLDSIKDLIEYQRQLSTNKKNIIGLL